MPGQLAAAAGRHRLINRSGNTSCSPAAKTLGASCLFHSFTWPQLLPSIFCRAISSASPPDSPSSSSCPNNYRP
ncbi:hypothetical protein LIA77_04506 [Sarocladium implicatum]|nr:hypothetical protein LIA77_04506 [Sarocladium implicatum]